MTLAEFVLARIAEDEEAARKAERATSSRWAALGSVLLHVGTDGLAEPLATVEDHHMDEGLRHVERHDPARVLAECEAKRQIVGHAGSADDWTLLTLLALPYADHPDYNETWRV